MKHFRCMLGWALLASPFVALAAFAGVVTGWLMVVAFFGGIFLVASMIFLGVYLIQDC